MKYISSYSLKLELLYFHFPSPFSLYRNSSLPRRPYLTMCSTTTDCTERASCWCWRWSCLSGWSSSASSPLSPSRVSSSPSCVSISEYLLQVQTTALSKFGFLLVLIIVLKMCYYIRHFSYWTTVAHRAAAGFLSRYLSGPFPCVQHHITIKIKMCWVCH